VKDLRGISTDIEKNKEAWRGLQHKVSKEGKTLLAQYEAEWKPLEQKEPVLIKIITTVKRTDTTYDVRWQEKRYNKNLEWVDTSTWSGNFTFTLQRPSTEEERQASPWGIFFHVWNWQKEGR
jgi:type IV secretion system protein VirB5